MLNSARIKRKFRVNNNKLNDLKEIEIDNDHLLKDFLPDEQFELVPVEHLTPLQVIKFCKNGEDIDLHVVTYVI